MLRQFLEDIIHELTKIGDLVTVNDVNAEYMVTGPSITDEHLTTLGQIIAIALITKSTLPVRFTRSFIKLLLKREVKFYDMPSFRNVEITFVIWFVIIHILKPWFIAFDDNQLFEGYRKGMADGMSEEDIYETCQEKITPLRANATKVRQSLETLIPREILDKFTAESFCLLVSGQKTIDTRRLKKEIVFKNTQQQTLHEQNTECWLAHCLFVYLQTF